MEEEQKFRNLDGLRGLAALFVMFWHFAIGFLPFLVGVYATTRHTPLDRIIPGSPLFIPFAGTFCVYVFFVLSGFVLSLSFFRKRTSGVLISAAARRYFRLMIPALGSVILAYLAITFLGTKHHSVASAITQSPWLAMYWNAPVSLFAALHQGIYSVFFGTNPTADTSFNPNLWTMQIELYGSFFLFMFLALFGKLERRLFFYFGFTIILARTNFLAFLLGIAICDIWHNYPELKAKINQKVATVLLAVGLLLGSWNATYDMYHSWFSGLRLPLFTAVQTQTFVLTVGAACIVLAVLRLNWLARFFELRPLQFLGRISFSLYLLHWVILYSFSSYIFNILFPHAGYFISFGLMFAISVPVILGIAALYTRYVDAAAISWSKHAGNWLLSTSTQRHVHAEPEISTTPATALAE